MSTESYAYIDESNPHPDLDPGAYVLAATICQPTDGIREHMQALRARGQVKVRWRNENDKRRRQIISTVADLPDVTHVAVVRVGPPKDRQERRRRKGLEVLLDELDRRGFKHVVLESRGKHGDRYDLDLVNHLRGARRLSPDLRIEHIRGCDEPLLWIPDAVCGAVAAYRTADQSYWNALSKKATLIKS